MAADGLVHHCLTYGTAVSLAIGFCRNFLGQGKLQDIYFFLSFSPASCLRAKSLA